MFTHSARLYDALYGWKDYAAEARALRDLIERHRRSRGVALLDVACGTGAHLAQLRAWYAVQGLELDRGMLAVARERLPDVPLHAGDMTDFGLGKRFDAVVCLFSSIGYVRTVERLRRAVRVMAAHLAPGGVLVVEPWFFPETWAPGRVHANFVDHSDLKVARMSVSATEGRLAVLRLYYQVGAGGRVSQFEERHELGLFTRAEYEDAFRAAGLEVSFDERGLMGRGLFIGVAPARAAGVVLDFAASTAGRAEGVAGAALSPVAGSEASHILRRPARVMRPRTWGRERCGGSRREGTRARRTRTTGPCAGARPDHRPA